MPRCQANYCDANATVTVEDSLLGERHMCARCAHVLGYTEDPNVEREAELRMERDALHRLNGGWPDYGW